jgi:hypothetical protein
LNYSFAVVLLAFLLGVLRLPSSWVTLMLKRRSVLHLFKHFWITWFFQTLVVAGGIYLADRIGLLNPVGYVIAITTFTSALGASILWVLHRPSRILP